MQTTQTQKKASRKALETAIDAAKGAGQVELANQLQESLRLMDELNLVKQNKKKRQYSDEQKRAIEIINNAWDSLFNGQTPEADRAQSARDTLIGSTYKTTKGKTRKITGMRIYFDTVTLAETD